jgi:hypothetical protein
MKISDNVEDIILKAAQDFDGNFELKNPFEELLSFGELVDRLSVVNYKLYTLKDQVMLRANDEQFRGWASVEDVKLCRERSRLKRCIDEKLIAMIARINLGDSSAGHNAETKLYGGEI